MRWATYGTPRNCGQAVKHPRWEPDAGKPHVRFCGGALQSESPDDVPVSLHCKERSRSQANHAEGASR